MTVRSPEGRGSARAEAYGLLLLAAGVAAVLAVWDPAGAAVGGLAVAVGFALSAALRATGRAWARSIEFVPAVGALGYLAVVAPIALLTELLAGVGGLALLLWLAADPDRPVGNVRRAADPLVVPTLGLALALATSLLAPPGAVDFGLAAALLGAALLVAAWALGRPDLGAAEPAPTL